MAAERVFPETRWLLHFANLGRAAGRPAPPLYLALRSPGFGRYALVGGERGKKAEVIETLPSGRGEYVTQYGRRWFRTPKGVLCPAPPRPPLSLEIIRDFVQRRGSFAVPSWGVPGETFDGERLEFFLWSDGKRKIHCPLADLPAVPEETAKVLVDEIYTLRDAVRDLLYWVLFQRDTSVLADPPEYLDRDLGPPWPPALNREWLEAIASGRRLGTLFSPGGQLRFWGESWPDTIHAEVLTVLQDHSWWLRLAACGWCGRFFIRNRKAGKGRPLDFDTKPCQKRFSGFGPGDIHS